jgi:hypothetical protein
VKNALLVLFGIVVLTVVGFMIYDANTSATYEEITATPISITDDPIQTAAKDVTLAPMQLGKGRFFFTPKAAYNISGMLVGRKHYFRGFMDRLSPWDYSLVWGTMPAMLPYIKFSNTSRFCFYKYKDASKVDRKYLDTHMSNNHLIPSTQNIRRAFKTVRKGNLVQIEGYLVNVMANLQGKGTTNWKTSTKRTDTGNGACEIIYVTRLRIGDKLYE